MNWNDPDPTDRDEWVAARLLASEWGRDDVAVPEEHVRFFGQFIGVQWARDRASLGAVRGVAAGTTPRLGQLSWWSASHGYALPWDTQGEPEDRPGIDAAARETFLEGFRDGAQLVLDKVEPHL